MRRREAQGRCPSLEVLPNDLMAEARRWEPAVAAIEMFAPGAEVLQPGQLALGARGPSRYLGGDLALATRVAATVEAVVGQAGGDSWAGCCKVGIADGLFAAGLAARRAPAGEPLIVGKGGSADFLAPLPVRALALTGLGSPAGRPGSGDLAGLADLLARLGLKTLRDFAALPASSVLGRFGAEGQLAHRLARGLGERAVRARLPPPDWVVAAELDPPADQLHAAAFVGKALAEELHSRLSAAGLVCTRLVIEAETEYGTTLRRSWRHDGALSAAAIGERVRWQLEGWALAGHSGETARGGAGAPASGSTGPSGASEGDTPAVRSGSLPEPDLVRSDGTVEERAAGVSPEARLRWPFSLGLGPQAGNVDAAQGGGIIKLALVPEEVCPDEGRQLGFWGSDAAAATKAARALARVQGLLGPEAALTGMLQGGRDYTEQVLLVPWGEPRVPQRLGTPIPGTPTGRTGRTGPSGPSKSLRRPAGPARPGRAKDDLPPWPGHLPGLAPAIVHQPPLLAQLVDQAGDPVSVGSRGTASARPARLTIGSRKPMAITAWAGPWPLEERWWDAGGRRRARFQVCTIDGAAYLLAREGRRWWVEATYD